MTNKTILAADNIGKVFNKRPVVRHVSLSIQQGEIVGLLGPNGAGKTTCFYMLCGLIKPDYGHVWLNDQDITKLPMYRRAKIGIGYLPQEASIFRGMTVQDNIKTVLEITDLSKDKQDAMLEQLLTEFSISHLRQAPALALSGGERRRVEIARALALDPQFILLDEPFAGIDPIAILDLRQLVLKLKEKGIGVLITDHNVRDTLALVDRAYILNDGIILAEGDPKDIVKQDEVRNIYLGKDFKL
jgi:lipopolysaccharide export system ATP-binding protein